MFIKKFYLFYIGLKCVISSLNDIYPRTDFISGTRNPITFYYSATCCDKTVKITAIDLLNNYNTIIIDVTGNYYISIIIFIDIIYYSINKYINQIYKNLSLIYIL